MSFQNQFESERATGQTKRLIAKKIDWLDGLTVVGQYVGRDVIKAKKRKQKDFNVYRMMTDDGMVSFTLGSAMDKQIGEGLIVGHLYAIQYTGKRDIGGGHQMNTFDCQEFGLDSRSETVNEADLVFEDETQQDSPLER